MLLHPKIKLVSGSAWIGKMEIGNGKMVQKLTTQIGIQGNLQTETVHVWTH
jgi:hypothetical protein